MRKLFVLLCLVASCGGIPTKTVRIKAINDKNEPVRCLIVVDGKWPAAGENASYTDSEVVLPFKHGVEAPVEVIVKPITLLSGKEKEPPERADETLYKYGRREIVFGDPSVHLFILTRQLIAN